MISSLFNWAIKIAALGIIIGYGLTQITEASTLPVCDTAVTYPGGDTTLAAECLTGWREIDAQNLENISWSVSNLDVSLAVEFFASGFVLFLVPWVASLGAGFLINFVRSA